MRQAIEEVVGWLGSGLIVLAFTLTTLEIRSPTGLDCLLLNLIGSLGVGYITFKRRAYPALFLNVVWAIVALTGLVQHFLSSLPL